MRKHILLLVLMSIFIVPVAVGCGNNAKMGVFPRSGTPRYIIANDEFATLYNERIYYSYSSGFFSMNTDGSDQQKLNDVFASYIHIVNGKIYLSNSNYRGYIFSMNIDGTDLQQLNDDSVWGISVIDDWIYYNISRNSGNRYGDDGMGIYKMRTDGSERQLLTDDEVNDFYVVGDIIYYSTLDGHFSISIDGRDRQTIDSRTYLTHIIGDHYFVNENNGKIYSRGADGSVRQLSDGEWITLFGGPTLDGDETYTYYIFIYKTGS